VVHQLHCLGPRPADQVRAAIQQAAFPCVPSLWDVFNVTVMEAIAAGTPVLCSSGASAAMLQAHLKSGFLFDAEQPTQLAQTIRSLQTLTDTERLQLTAQAKAHAAVLGDAAVIVGQYQSLYKKTMAGFQGRGPSPTTIAELHAVIQEALVMPPKRMMAMRQAVARYYRQHLEPVNWWRQFVASGATQLLINAEELSVPLMRAP
jgi:hypothetical protein